MTPFTTAHSLIDQWRRGDVLAANCPSRGILQHLTSKWGTLVMVTLATGPHRFAQLRRRIDGVSERMLAQTLQQLEADGFILRVARDVVPPHVSYSLTPLGTEAAAHVIALTAWIESNLPRMGATPAQPEPETAL
ncbi:transcriptional regulator [Tabrizicola sp. WMC-M-20]|nr:transcriptional regulator [Tabrizicola sp. WMC-M-20]